ncbi:hypothetical protein pb186bvf_007806 [Paramecium bursaria]
MQLSIFALQGLILRNYVDYYKKEMNLFEFKIHNQTRETNLNKIEHQVLIRSNIKRKLLVQNCVQEFISSSFLIQNLLFIYHITGAIKVFQGVKNEAQRGLRKEFKNMQWMVTNQSHIIIEIILESKYIL